MDRKPGLKSPFRMILLVLFAVILQAALFQPHSAKAGGIVTTGDFYYVDITNGSDVTGDGSEANPWKTLHFAIPQVPEGGTLIIKPGTYSIDNGEQDAPLAINRIITISGSGSDTIIDGTNTTSWIPCMSVTADAVIQDLSIWNFPAGIEVTGASPLIQRNIFTSNSSAIMVTGSSIEASPTIQNNQITSGIFGIEIFAESGDANPMIWHNTIYGMENYGISMAVDGSIQMSPSVLYNIIANTGTGIFNSNGTPQIDYNDLWMNITNYNGAAAGPNDIQVDPQFVAPEVLDFHIKESSPCIDAIPTSENDPVADDLEQGPRPQGSGFDMGCYEYVPLFYGVVWDGGGDGTSWTDPANWDPDAVPQPGDDVFIDMDGTYTVNLESDAQIASLTLGSPDNTGIQELAVTGATLTVTGGLTIKGSGSLSLAGATVSAQGSFENFGEIHGTGTMDVASGFLSNHGKIAPGLSPGALTVNGDFTQSQEGVLSIELAGTTAGDLYDQLIVTGIATLGGMLEVMLVDPFSPAVSDNFDVITYGAVQEEFEPLNLPDLPDGRLWESDYLAGSLSLKVVPDTDLDGMNDDWEIAHFGDLSHDGTQDTDNDELTDLLEYQEKTDPTDPDSDGDGYADSEELNFQTDPNDPADHPVYEPGEYFVDANGASPIGAGTRDNPWRSLHYAIHHVNEGNPGAYIINVLPGIYSTGGEEPDTELLVYQDDVTIIGDASGTSILSGDSANTWQNGIDITGNRVVINHLKFTSFSGAGIYADGAQDVQVMSNYITACGSGIVFDNTTGTISGNLAMDNEQAGIRIHASAADISPRVENNLVGNFLQEYGYIGVTGIEVSAEQGYSATPEIYHNTITGGNADGIDFLSADAAGSVKYNIIEGFNIGIYKSPDPGQDPLIDYNDLWNNGIDYQNVIPGPSDLHADPMFTGIGGDFHLLASSPCIDAVPPNAEPVPPVADDLDGVVRPQQDAYDMGCYEYFFIDTDSDGMDDVWEWYYFGSLDRDGTKDFDYDGLTDGEEFNNKTDPTEWDSDSDGMPDGWELTYGLDPTDPSDGSIDTDGDTYSNQQEFIDATDPTDNADFAALAGAWFVDPVSGDDAKSGRSWEYAKKSFDAVFKSITDRDLDDPSTPQTIHVKEGTFTKPLMVYNFITIMGGYPDNLTGTDLTGRDPSTYMSIIDAQGAAYGISPVAYGWDTIPKDLWMDQQGDAYAVCESGDIFFHDGDSVTKVYTYDQALYAVWGTGVDNVYAAGNAGSLLHYDGASWTRIDITAQPLNALWASGPNDVFAAGNNGTILHFDGANWAAMASGTNLNINALWGSGPNDVFAAGNNGTILHYDGNTWTAMDSTVTDHLFGLWGFAPDNVYAVGASGVILHYDGNTWAAMASPTTGYLRDIWGASPEDIYAVGWGGTICHYDGNAWVTEPVPVSWNLETVWGMKKDIIVLGGTELNPLVYEFDEGIWDVEFPDSQDITIDGLVVKNSSNAAVDFFRKAWEIRLLNNKIENNQKGAINFEKESDQIELISNTFSQNPKNYIEFYFTTSNVTIYQNSFTGGNDSSGYIYFDWDASNVDVSDNTFSDLTGDACGIHFWDISTDITVNRNTFTNLQSHDAGIHFWSSATRPSVTENTISGITGHDAGIHFWDTADDTQVNENEISGLDGDNCGIHFWDRALSQTEVLQNSITEITGDDPGIHFWDDIVAGQISENTLSTITGDDPGIIFWSEVTGTIISQNNMNAITGAGAGIIFWGLISDADIMENHLSNFGGPGDASLAGSGIVLHDQANTVYISDNQLENFESAFAAGPTHLGILLLNDTTQVSVTRNLLESITGQDKDGIIFEDNTKTSQSARITKNTIKNLITSGPGAGISFSQTATDCSIANNIVESSTLGIYSSSPGGLLIVHNTLYNNQQGITEAGGAGAGNIISNNIVANCTGTGIQVIDASSNTLLSTNDVYNCNPAYTGIQDQTGISGNIALDPVFTDPAGGDFSLAPGSPCIDTGIDQGITDDITGAFRPQLQGYDMGAYEYGATDADGDGLEDHWEIINFGDSTTFDGDADPDGDGLANLTEFELFTDPMSPDTDNDLYRDGEEYAMGSDPNDPASFPQYLPGEYWVDSNNPDFGDGTQANPWQTLHAALFRINGGAAGAYTLHVGGGIYATAANSGLESDLPLEVNQANVEITGDAAQRPLIIGNLNSQWVAGLMIKASGVVVSGLHFKDFATGIVVESKSPVIERNIFQNCGQGIFVFSTSQADPVIQNNLIYYDTQSPNQIAINIVATAGNAAPSILHNTMDGGSDTGISIMDNGSGNAAPNIAYNIITNFQEAGINADSPITNIRYNDLFANGTNFGGQVPDLTGTSGNISSDPLYGSYTLQVASPCIDAIPENDHPETVTQDINMNPRPQGPGYDMGCYETEKPVFSVIFTAGNHGSISGETSQNVTYGDSTTQVTAVPDNGYHFTGWSGDIDSTDNPLVVQNVTTDMNITANFAINTYTVTPSAGDHGTITPDTPQTVEHGQTVSFTITPDTGYHIVSVTGTCGGTLTGNTYTTNPVESDCTVAASFGPDTFSVNFTAGPGGTILGDTPQTVEYGGSTTQVTAVPDNGYHFTGWSGDIDSTDNPLVVQNVTKEMNITANFAINTYTVTPSAGDHGTIAPDTPQTVEHGQTVSFTITPDTGYHIASVTGTCGGTLSNAAYTTDPVESDCTVTASFEPDTFSVDFFAGTGGTIEGETSQTVEYGGSTTEVTAVADAGYEFSGWSGDYTGSQNPLTIDNVTSDMTITANFIASANLPPDTPALLSPENNSLVQAGPVTLQAGAYSDPENDAHISSHWQVWRYGGTEPVFDVESDTDLTSIEIPGGLPEGFRYLWRVGYMDAGSMTYTWSGFMAFTVGESLPDRNMPDLPPGVDMADYRMVSVVAWPANPLASAVFGPLVNTANIVELDDYRIGTYDPKINGYRRYPNFDVVPGKAYWILARNGMNLDLPGVAVPLDTDITVPLTYNPETGNGWNMIAPPNNAGYRWNELLVATYDENGILITMPVTQAGSYIEDAIWQWNTGVGDYSRESGDFLLRPYHGYWVKVKAPNVFLVFPQSAQVLADTGSTTSWLKNFGSMLAQKIFGPAEATAETADTPPMPMEGFVDGASGQTPSCFIRTLDDR